MPLPDNLLRDTIRAVIKRRPDIVALLGEDAVTLAKARDPKEPGLERKQKHERKLIRLMQARLSQQFETIKESLGAKSTYDASIPLGHNDAEILALIIQMLYDGLSLFDETTPTEIEMAAVNQRAVEYAQSYVTKWLQGLDAVSTEALRRALIYFETTPGASVGDIIGQLLPHFSPVRAERIAVTETTRMYAMANQLAGQELAAKFPGVKVTKMWMTNVDDLVCPICRPLDGKEVPLDQAFNADGVFNPPAHVNCRCWTSVTTV